MRFNRPGRGRPRVREVVDFDPAFTFAPPITARNGANESLVTSPAHTRSHSAARISGSIELGAAARS